jgi:pimeloyl-ACP methyl ester carboxylesterase
MLVFTAVKRSGLFQKYDKGPFGNLFAYGQVTPPVYDLSSFPTSFPVQIFSGGRDGLADPEDFQNLLSSLPAGLNKEVHNFPNYGHLDFMIGDNAYLDIYPLILSFLE